jgi:hypothetical protein
VGILPKPQFRGAERPVDDVVVAAHRVVDQFALTGRPNHEERRRLALVDPRREFDIDLGSVIEGANRTPRRICRTINSNFRQNLRTWRRLRDILSSKVYAASENI